MAEGLGQMRLAAPDGLLSGGAPSWPGRPRCGVGAAPTATLSPRSPPRAQARPFHSQEIFLSASCLGSGDNLAWKLER